LLSRSPDIGRSLGGKSRRLNLSAFPYFLAYSHRRGCLVVTAVLHQARDPQDVKRRLE
jgi:plasmid stabilization system protein ParE